MRAAMISPVIISRPTTGFRTRMFQTQTMLARIATSGAAVWDISRESPYDLAFPLPANELNPRPKPSIQQRIRYTLQNLVALALHLNPNFRVQALKRQRERIVSWLDTYRPDIVVLAHPWATELLPSLVARGLRVFVETQNVESDLVRQMVPLATALDQRVELMVRWKTLERMEQQLFPLAESVWMPSHADVRRQRAISGDRASIVYIPNGLDVGSFAVNDGPRSLDIVLPAYFGHSPNVVGARALRDEVLPQVMAAIPETRLVLLGRDPSGAAKALAVHPNICATGEVPDTRPYLSQAGVIAVPIFQGGGTRYKILEALAMGLPVVTTPLGCEGIDVHDDEHLLVRELHEFASAIISVLRDPVKANARGRRGRALVAQHYSWESVERALRDAVLVSVNTLST